MYYEAGSTHLFIDLIGKRGDTSRRLIILLKLAVQQVSPGLRDSINMI